MTERLGGTTAALAVEEVVPGVHRLPLGRELTETNAYLVESGAAWTLVDTGWPQHAREVLAAAKGLFGTRAAPSGIVLTHLHPDHSGAAPELVRRWDVPVYLHPDEVPFARGGYDPSTPTRWTGGSRARCCVSCHDSGWSGRAPGPRSRPWR